MQHNIPKFDIPVNFLVGNNIKSEILSLYTRFPCKIKAGVFVLCTGGEIKATINLNQYHVKKNDLVALTPGSFIQIHEVSDNIALNFAAFSSQFIGSMSFNPIVMDNPVIELTDELSILYERYFHLLIDTYESTTMFINQELTRSILNIFLQSLNELYKSSKAVIQPVHSRSSEIYKEFLQLAMENYFQEHSVSFYADKLGITLQHFCNTIKKTTGKTALEIITAIIIMDAKAQLKSTDLPIKKIAAALGFNNQAFFNKYFKQHVGMTPQEYRKS